MEGPKAEKSCLAALRPAARYANPLTGLPGNVPIQEHMERLLVNEQSFVTAYFDLDHFKPYSDVYGFRRGDVIIQLLARILRDAMPAASASPTSWRQTAGEDRPPRLRRRAIAFPRRLL